LPPSSVVSAGSYAARRASSLDSRLLKFASRAVAACSPLRRRGFTTPECQHKLCKHRRGGKDIRAASPQHSLAGPLRVCPRSRAGGNGNEGHGQGVMSRLKKAGWGSGMGSIEYIRLLPPGIRGNRIAKYIRSQHEQRQEACSRGDQCSDSPALLGYSS
jgi:hypothetical protein